MKFTWGLPSVVGRPPPEVSRPNETSFGRGRGRCEVLVSIFGGGVRGDASGDVEGEGEGEAAPSGRRDDMLAATLRIVLRWLWLWLERRGRSLVAYRRKDHAR
jgi:hypothetical protein